MKNDLLNNSNLIDFFNSIFQNEELTKKAPLIMKFFIITRNYGLLNYQENIEKIVNNANINDLIIEVIKDGFKKSGIPFNNHNLLTYITYNYHQNGFYFHSFPEVYKDSIEENGILASNRNEDDKMYYNIIKKYGFNNYFTSSDNRVCVSEKLSIAGTHEYSLFTPEWLEIFLREGSSNVHEAFKQGNVDEMLKIADESLKNIKKNMMANSEYRENDFTFLQKYLNNVVENRFKNGNDKIGIALIEKQKTADYFGKYIKLDDLDNLEKYVNARGFDEKGILDFVVNGLSNGEKDSKENIPANLISIISYRVKNDTDLHDRTI